MMKHMIIELGLTLANIIDPIEAKETVVTDCIRIIVFQFHD